MLKDFTIDMAWEQLKFVNAHDKDFGRIAVVVDDIWIKFAAHISDLLTPHPPEILRHRRRSASLAVGR